MDLDYDQRAGRIFGVSVSYRARPNTCNQIPARICSRRAVGNPARFGCRGGVVVSHWSCIWRIDRDGDQRLSIRHIRRRLTVSRCVREGISSGKPGIRRIVSEAAVCIECYGSALCGGPCCDWHCGGCGQTSIVSEHARQRGSVKRGVLKNSVGVRECKRRHLQGAWYVGRVWIERDVEHDGGVVRGAGGVGDVSGIGDRVAGFSLAARMARI